MNRAIHAGPVCVVSLVPVSGEYVRSLLCLWTPGFHPAWLERFHFTCIPERVDNCLVVAENDFISGHILLLAMCLNV